MNTIPFIFIPIGFKQLAAFVLFAAPRGNLMRSDGDKPKSSGFMSGIYFLTGHIYVKCQRICCTEPPYYAYMRLFLESREGPFLSYRRMHAKRTYFFNMYFILFKAIEMPFKVQLPFLQFMR